MSDFKTVVPESYGLAVRAGTNRGLYCCQDADGRDCLVIWLQDATNDRILQVDAETGTTESIPVPQEMDFAVFSSLRSKAGKSYSLYCSCFLEYDPALKKFTFYRKLKKNEYLGMVTYEDEAGKIWSISYPDSHLFCFDPATGEFTEYGQIDKTDYPQYSYSMVKDGDLIYAGLGFVEGRVVCFDLATGEARQLLAPEDSPKGETMEVCRFSDGNIYACGKECFFIIRDGRAERIAALPEGAVEMKNPAAGRHGFVMSEFCSGRKLVDFDMTNKTFATTAADGSDRKEVSFDFDNRGTSMMDITVNDQGVLAGGGSFPFFFGKLDTATGEKSVEFAGVQCNTIAACGKYFYIGAYHGGQLLRFDPDKPWDLQNAMKIDDPDFNSNPVFYGAVRKEVCRPHAIAVAPDGSWFVVGGTPAYGTTGGGIAIVDCESGKYKVIPHTDLIENEAPHALVILNDELLLGGTAVYPGTGGVKMVEEGSLFLYNIRENKTIWRSKALGSPMDAVFQLLMLDDNRVLGYTSNSEVFLLDLTRREIIYKQDISAIAPAAMAGSCRALLKDDDGRIFFLGKKHIARLDPENGSIIRAFEVAGGIQMSGAIYDGKVWFAGEKQWKSLVLSELFD